MRKLFCFTMALNILSAQVAIRNGVAVRGNMAAPPPTAASPSLMNSASIPYASVAGSGTITTSASALCNGANAIDIITFNFGASTATMTPSDSTNGGSSFGINTYTNVGNFTGGGSYNVGVWRVQNPTTSSNMAWRMAGGNYPSIHVACWANVTGGVTASNGNNTGTNTAFLSAGSVTPTGSGQLLVALFSWTTGNMTSTDNSCTIAANVSQTSAGGSLGFCWKIQGAVSVNVTATLDSPPGAGGAGAMAYAVNHN